MQRYASTTYYRFTDDGDYSSEEITTAQRYTSYTSSTKRIYTAFEGDTFRTIARTQLGDEALWWTIADLNYRIDLYAGMFGLPAGALIELTEA